MWLTLLALRNRIGILMLSLAMVILGATSVQRLPVDLFPQEAPGALIAFGEQEADAFFNVVHDYIPRLHRYSHYADNTYTVNIRFSFNAFTIRIGLLIMADHESERIPDLPPDDRCRS